MSLRGNPISDPSPAGTAELRVVQIRFEECLGSATTLYEPWPSPFCRPACPCVPWDQAICLRQVKRGTHWEISGPFDTRVPYPLATVLSFQLPSPICHSERSRGICSSADLSWKRGIQCSSRTLTSSKEPGSCPWESGGIEAHSRFLASLRRKTSRPRAAEPQVPPLRFAPVGMTRKG